MRIRGVLQYVGAIAVLSLLLTGVTLLVVIPQHGAGVSIVYPAAGLGFALLWGFGFRWWPAIVLSHFALSYWASRSIPVAVLVACAELLVAAVLYQLLERWRVSRDLSRLRDLGLFVLWSVVATAAGGSFAFGGQVYLDSTAMRDSISQALAFWFSDLVSLLVFVPLVLTWKHFPFATNRQLRNWIVLSVALVGAGTVIVVSGAASSTLFLLLPLVVFIAMASGVAGAASSGAILLLVILAFPTSRSLAEIEPLIRALFVGTATATGYVVGILWNEKEQAAARLEHIARRDSLTGLFNRFELETQLQHAVSGPGMSVHALLYLDLDQFKLLNDTCGHMAGDLMLSEVAGELRSSVPENALLCRIGGDEFACLLMNSGKDEALNLAHVVHETLARYHFSYGGQTFGAGVSIGVTLFPWVAGETADSVLGRADVACYMAKDGGRNRTHLYSQGDEAMLRWHSGIQQASQIEMGLQSGKFKLYRQAIIDIRRGAKPLNFYEVLLRLEQDGEVRQANEFIPFAQQFGMMDRIDRWVVDNACRFLADRAQPRLRLSVNVSGSTLNEPSFYEMVSSMPDRYGIDPSQLCLEVTEGMMIPKLRQAVIAMGRLREKGFDIALDDFGAGVSSFAYLHELPVSFVKLDGRFVRDLRTDRASEVIIDSLVRLARIRGIECIAEWVDSTDTITRLKSLGVSYVQGFFLDIPRPLEDPFPEEIETPRNGVEFLDRSLA